ncbi:hypothetical protein [Yoonia sp. BS5-3]|uniref:Uncharacterized protein n=1 Tax=Yoonia phaeophyticola TaxID=3137369 RepID=A0ABZ2V5G9_9RHOB
MSDISALESRITAALDRIRRGLETAGQGSETEMSLRKALEAERATNAELVVRVQSLQERQDSQVAKLTARVETQAAQMKALDAELQRLRASNEKMRSVSTQLRDAVTEGLRPELVEDAVKAEIEALVSQRAADATEIETILAELKPLLKEQPNAAS